MRGAAKALVALVAVVLSVCLLSVPAAAADDAAADSSATGAVDGGVADGAPASTGGTNCPALDSPGAPPYAGEMLIAGVLPITALLVFLGLAWVMRCVSLSRLKNVENAAKRGSDALDQYGAAVSRLAGAAGNLEALTSPELRQQLEALAAAFSALKHLAHPSTVQELQRLPQITAALEESTQAARKSAAMLSDAAKRSGPNLPKGEARVSNYYDTKNIVIYHSCKNCTKGSAIPKDQIKAGKGRVDADPCTECVAIQNDSSSTCEPGIPTGT